MRLPQCAVRGLILLLAAAVWSAPAPAAEALQSSEQLPADFNADAGQVRLVLLLDPT